MNLGDLYRELIVDHNRSPRNFGRLDPASHEAEGFNPLCGDKLHLYLDVTDDRIADIRFEGSGCAISTASASLMTDAVRGKTTAEADALFARMRALLKGDDTADSESLGKLAALGGVRAFPSRIKCANLCWHALHEALHGGITTTTE